MTRIARTVLVLLLFSGAANTQEVRVGSNLQFGTVFPGVPASVDKTASGAATFDISGSDGAEITIDFVLPTYMYYNGRTMRLVFSDTDCAMDSTASPSQSSPGNDDLDPWKTLTYGIGANGLVIWLGGKVVPDLVQQPGAYAADITVTVAYTGS